MTPGAPCHLLHVDMDAFYASVMTRDRPDLADRPVIVGGGHRGVVLSANYAARRFGVRSGMSGYQAHLLCPLAVFVPPDFDLLRPVSRAIMDIFRAFTPVVEVTSLDEAFLDVRGAERLFGGPEEIADAVRARVLAEQGITCSVGIAAAVSVAKLASRRAKPDGVLTIAPDRFARIVHPLDVGELYGVGEATRTRLHKLGMRTVGDLASRDRTELQRLIGRHLGGMLHALAHGSDRSDLSPGGAGVFGFGEGVPERSMGAQHTLASDVRDRDRLARELLALATRVVARVRAAGRLGRVVAVTVRFSDFSTASRSRTLAEPTDGTLVVYHVAVRLLDQLLDDAPRQRVRLVGVRLEGLRPSGPRSSRQLAFGEPDPGWPAADRAMDAVDTRFGRGTVRSASLLH